MDGTEVALEFRRIVSDLRRSGYTNQRIAETLHVDKRRVNRVVREACLRRCQACDAPLKTRRKKACESCCPTAMDYHRFRAYGITRRDFETLWTSQQGLCALCPVELSEERQYGLNVDHCHTTGRVRGLLCINCNRLLGQIEARSDWFDRVRSYLAAT